MPKPAAPEKSITIFANLYVHGRNPDVARWPEDERRARAGFLLDVIEAANDEVERIIPNVYYRDFEVENAVIDAREWLEGEGVPAPPTTPGRVEFGGRRK